MAVAVELPIRVIPLVISTFSLYVQAQTSSTLPALAALVVPSSRVRFPGLAPLYKLEESELKEKD